MRCAGLCINTAALDAAAAGRIVAEHEREFGLPACDPVRFGVDPIVDGLLAE